MNASTLTALGSAGAKLMASDKAKGLLTRIFHKLYKRLRLKSVRAIIIPDYVKNSVNMNFNSSKFRVVVLENVFMSMLSDGEMANYRRLKLESPESWSLALVSPLKKLLNSIRWKYKDKKIIVILTSYDLARQLHIKNIEIYSMSDYLYKEISEKLDEKSKSYHARQHKELSKLPHIDVESMDHFKRAISKSASLDD